MPALCHICLLWADVLPQASKVYAESESGYFALKTRTSFKYSSNMNIGDIALADFGRWMKLLDNEHKKKLRLLNDYPPDVCCYNDSSHRTSVRYGYYQWIKHPTIPEKYLCFRCYSSWKSNLPDRKKQQSFISKENACWRLLFAIPGYNRGKKIPRGSESKIGKKNPMYGLRGIDCPNFGRTREDMRGSNNGSYKGGITPLVMIIRNDTMTAIMNKEVLERDNYTCQSCGVYGVKFHVHHLVLDFSTLFAMNNIKSLEQARDSYELFDPVHCITVCVPCHKKLDFRNKKKHQR